MKAVLIAIALAITVAGCSAGAGPVVPGSGADMMRDLDKQGRGGHNN